MSDERGEPSAVEQLRRAYEFRLEHALRQPRPIAGVTSNTAPWEILRAAGYFPVLLSPPRAPSPAADEYMEDVFDVRIRSIFEHLLAGDWPRVELLVIPRTSEQEHKLFLYLAEVARQEPQRRLPRTLLYNLPHARLPEAPAYGLDRTRALVRDVPPTTDRALVEAIAESNAARQALRRLLRLRGTRLTGAEALPLLGPFYFMGRTDYAALAMAAADEIAQRPAVTAPRVIVKGSPADHPHLHAAVESHGLVVAAEDDWWGSRAAGADVATDGDPVEAIFDKYFLDAPSPRVFPPAAADEWFLGALADVAGVVFYLPPDDDVLGWDYPRQRAELDRRGVPHLLIRDDASGGRLPDDCHERLAAFARRLSSSMRSAGIDLRPEER
jgi:benzoyl-CoA reductase subunit C